MKILVVSNIFPPAYVGGYELGCRDAVDGLRRQGHDVVVLTSRYPDGVNRVEGHIHRKLTLFFGRPAYWKVLVREVRNQAIFRRYCREFRPDVVFFWKTADLSMALLPIASALGHRTCLYVFDTWVAEWRSDRFVELGTRMGSLLRAALPEWCLGFRLRIAALPLENAVFASTYLQRVTEERLGPVKHAAVVPWGVDASRYFPAGLNAPCISSRVLYVGQVVQHKGVHVALEAFALARQRSGLDLTLTIVGDTEQSPDYVAGLRDSAVQLGLDGHVAFTGKIERDLLPEIYHCHDVLVFPSLWEEPFGLTLLEAMSSGLAVVASGTGGSTDFLKDGYNALLYPKDDPRQCAERIVRLCTDRELCGTIRRNGRRTVETRYTLQRATEEIEGYLAMLVTA